MEKLDEELLLNELLEDEEKELLVELENEDKLEVNDELKLDDEDEELDFVIYPNPAQTKVNFLGLNSPVQATVFDMLGKYQLQSEVINSLDVSQLKPGLYVVEIKDEDGIKAFNILKK